MEKYIKRYIAECKKKSAPCPQRLISCKTIRQRYKAEAPWAKSLETPAFPCRKSISARAFGWKTLRFPTPSAPLKKYKISFLYSLKYIKRYINKFQILR